MEFELDGVADTDADTVAEGVADTVALGELVGVAEIRAAIRRPRDGRDRNAIREIPASGRGRFGLGDEVMPPGKQTIALASGLRDTSVGCRVTQSLACEWKRSGPMTGRGISAVVVTAMMLAAAARLLLTMGYDVIDLNLACPLKQG